MWLILGLLAAFVLKVLYFGMGIRNGRRQDWKERNAGGAGTKQASAGGTYAVVQAAAGAKPGLKKVVVTGASGYLGRSVVKQLAARGEGRLHVVAFDWHVAPPALPLPGAGVSYVQGEVTNRRHLKELLQGCSCVVHLSTSNRGGGQGLEQPVVSFQGTQGVVEVCMELDVPYLVYSSSTATITQPNVEQQQLSDSSPYPSAYVAPAAETRACAEQIVRAASSHILHTIILRVSHVYGLGDKGFVDAAMGRGILGQARDNLVPAVWVEDAARAHALAVEKMLFAEPRSSLTWGQPLNISSDPEDSPSFKELVGQVSPVWAPRQRSVWGKAVVRSRVPVWALEVLAGWVKGLQSVSGALGRSVMSQETINMWFKQSVRVGVEGAWQQLGWKPTPWREVVESIKKQRLENEMGLKGHKQD